RHRAHGACFLQRTPRLRRTRRARAPLEPFNCSIPYFRNQRAGASRPFNFVRAHLHELGLRISKSGRQPLAINGLSRVATDAISHLVSGMVPRSLKPNRRSTMKNLVHSIAILGVAGSLLTGSANAQSYLDGGNAYEAAPVSVAINAQQQNGYESFASAQRSS